MTTETRKQKKERVLRYVLKEMDIEDNVIDEVIVTKKIISISLLCSMTDEDIKDTLGLAVGEVNSILLFKKWYADYQDTNNKEPEDWATAFDNDTYETFVEANAAASGSASGIKSAPSSGNPSTDKDKDSTLRVKLSDYPSYNGDINGWYNFKKTFEATAEVAGFSDIIEAVAEGRDYITDYEKNTLFYRILQAVCAKGTAHIKVAIHKDTKDGAKAYASLCDYYDQDGDKDVYGRSTLENLLQLELNYDSPGGMHKYINKFEVYCNDLEETGQPLSEAQKLTFFINGIKDNNYENVKDDASIKTYAAAVNAARKKSIRLGAQAGNGRSRNNRRANNATTRNEEHRNTNKNNEKDGPYGFMPVGIWKKMTPEFRQAYQKIRNDNLGKKYGSQYNKKNDGEARRSNLKKQADKNKDNDNDVHVSFDDEEENGNAPKFVLASALKPRKQKMRKRTVLKVKQAHADYGNGVITKDDDSSATISKEPQVGYLDNGSDTFGIAGPAWIVDSYTGRKVTIEGFHEDMQKEKIKIGTGMTAIDLPDGETIIARANEATILGKDGQTLFSEQQMEHNNVHVKRTEQGTRYVDVEGYVIPIYLKDGMYCIDIRRPTEHELRSCTHVNLTDDMPWNPEEMNSAKIEPREYDILVNAINEDESSRHVYLRKTRDARESDWWKYNKYFLYPGEEVMKKTLQHTTRLGKISARYPMRIHYKSRNPLLQRARLHEGYATDTIFASVTSFESYNCAQPFVGVDSRYRAIYGMQTESNGPDALLDFFRDEGVPTSITRDNSKMQASATWNEYMRNYWCKDKFIEPYHPQQNPLEREMAVWKTDASKLMIQCNVDPRGWFRVLCHTADLHNHKANAANEEMVPPITKAKGEIGDITLLTEFHFNQEVLYQAYDSKFPDKGGNEKLGRWYGRAPQHGDKMCSWILNENTELIVRSNIRPAKTTERPNASVELSRQIKGSLEANMPIIGVSDDNLTNDINDETKNNDDGNFTDDEKSQEEQGRNKLYTFYPHKDLLNLQIEIIDKSRNGKESKKKGVIKEHLNNDTYRVELSNGKQRVYEYNEIIDILNKPYEDGAERYAFTEILNHRYRRGKLEVLVKWMDTDPTWEPFAIIKNDDPVTLAKYAKDKELLNQQKWKWAKKYVKTEQRFQRMLRQMLRKKRRKGIKYQFGVRVPRTIQEAYSFDERNGNKNWTDAICKEVDLLVNVFECFKIAKDGEITSEYQQIPLLWAFAVKYDGRHRARLVAGGHVTDDLEQDYYSGVVSLETIRIAFVVAALLALNVIAADIASAYIQALTEELVFTIAGPEFGKLAGMKLIIVKALYGLKASGAMWHMKWADNLREMGFRPCIADPDLWMRKKDNYYEYVAVMVDDLLVFSREPESIIEPITTYFEYEIKGVGPPEYYSGADMGYDQERKCWTKSAKTYIKNVVDKIEKLYDRKLKNVGSPLDAGDHPELDETDFLDEDETRKYQMLIGSAQWAITLGRYDIQQATNLLARFATMPREGHLERALRLFGYLKHYSRAKLHMDPQNMDLTGIKFEDHGWQDLYPDAEEYVADNAPEPLIRGLSLVTFKDASHASQLDTRRSVSGIMHFLGSAVISTYSKRQNVVESSTYGSELVAARLAVEQQLALRFKLRMMGIEVEKCSTILGDNKAVVTNMQLPSSTLKKKHNSCAFHKCREAVAAGYTKFGHVDTGSNPSDILTKNLGPADTYNLTGPILYNRFD